MTEPQAQNSLAEALPGEFFSQPLTFSAVWRETSAMARRHGLAFMGTLVVPVGKILLGLYGALGVSLAFTNWMSQPGQAFFVEEHRLLVLAVALVLPLAGLLLFINGCWQYVVHWASLCRNVREVLENRPPKFKAAYDVIAQQKKPLFVQWVSLLFVLLPLLPFAPLLLLPLLAGPILQLPNGFIFLAILAGLLLGGVLGLAWLAAQVLLTYGFQILALEETPGSISKIFKESVRLTLRRPWLTLGLQLSLFVATNYVLTVPINTLLRFSRLSQPLDQLHGWFAGSLGVSWQDTIQQMQLSGLAAQVMTQLKSEQLTLIQGFTDAIVGVVIPLLLLPLGTMAFTLVYLHLRSQSAESAE